MHDLSKTISEYIEQQFPAVYREDGPNLVAFTKAYYEFMENTSESPITLSRSMFQNRDIDETLDSFLVHFKEKYLSEFPYAKAVDKRFAIKHIMDYYRSKGTPKATELLKERGIAKAAKKALSNLTPEQIAIIIANMPKD